MLRSGEARQTQTKTWRPVCDVEHPPFRGISTFCTKIQFSTTQTAKHMAPAKYPVPYARCPRVTQVCRDCHYTVSTALCPYQHLDANGITIIRTASPEGFYRVVFESLATECCSAR